MPSGIPALTVAATGPLVLRQPRELGRLSLRRIVCSDRYGKERFRCLSTATPETALAGKVGAFDLARYWEGPFCFANLFTHSRALVRVIA